jgi:hypothetical protein
MRRGSAGGCVVVRAGGSHGGILCSRIIAHGQRGPAGGCMCTCAVGAVSGGLTCAACAWRSVQVESTRKLDGACAIM